MKLKRVNGCCPSCGGRQLFVFDDGQLLCRQEGCALPSAASQILNQGGETGHILESRNDGWTIMHPLRERLEGALFRCEVADTVNTIGPPAMLGYYRILATTGTGAVRAGHGTGTDWEYLGTSI